MISEEAAMRQAANTVDFYFHSAITSLDGTFGEGYAKKHPELVAVFINGCVKDYDTWSKRDLHDSSQDLSAYLAQQNS
jgi:hypothetical protein